MGKCIAFVKKMYCNCCCHSWLDVFGTRKCPSCGSYDTEEM